MVKRFILERGDFINNSTIKDVAKAAGVSIGTVSKLINQTGYVSDEIRERVLLAISLLNYKPNGIARSLKKSKTNTIGILVPDISNSCTMKMVKSIENVVGKLGYKIIFCSHNNNPEREAAALQWLMEKRVDGIVLYPSGILVDGLNVSKTFPLVLVEQQIEGISYDFVAHKNNHVLKSMVSHLSKEKRLQKILVVYTPNSLEERRIQEFTYEINLDQVVVTHLKVESSLKIDEIQEMIIAQFHQMSQPEIIFATSPLLLASSVKAGISLNLDFTKDIKIIGFGEIDPYNLLNLPVTIIVDQSKELGEITVNRLLERINERGITSTKEIYINPKVIKSGNTFKEVNLFNK